MTEDEKSVKLLASKKITFTLKDTSLIELKLHGKKEIYYKPISLVFKLYIFYSGEMSYETIFYTIYAY